MVPELVALPEDPGAQDLHAGLNMFAYKHASKARVIQTKHTTKGIQAVCQRNAQ